MALDVFHFRFDQPFLFHAWVSRIGDTTRSLVSASDASAPCYNAMHVCLLHLRFILDLHRRTNLASATRLNSTPLDQPRSALPRSLATLPVTNVPVLDLVRLALLPELPVRLDLRLGSKLLEVLKRHDFTANKLVLKVGAAGCEREVAKSS